MMKRSLIPTMALAVVLPAALWAQEGSDPAERIDEAFARAQAAGVPIEFLQAKQAEGKAKGVPIDQLAEVMEQRADALITARQAMPESDPRAVAAGAETVEAGIGADVLSYIEATVPSERRFVATFALTRLMEAGHVPAEALQAVEDALARGPQALADVATRADEERARRGPPEGVGPNAIPDIAGPPAGVPGPGSRPAGPPTGIPVGGPPGGG